jgi:DNA-binding LacI/PurR family transcriptional regulator
VLQDDGALVKGETRQAVARAIKQLGYEHNAVASNLRTARTKMMMLVTPDITNPFWPETARGLQDTVEVAGYSIVLANSDWDAEREDQFLRTARRNRFDGLALNPTAVTNQELLASGMPIVILGLREGFPDLDMVGSDTYGGTLEALDYLYRLGHRRIGFIRGRHNSGRGQARYGGYTDFLQQHALAMDLSLIVDAPFDVASGKQALQSLLRLPQLPTAVFASNDLLAIGAMQAAREAGLNVPADLSIIGMDDIYPSSLTTPGLTTMSKSKYEIGCQAGKFLLERINGKAPQRGRRHVIPCQLIVRGSTAPPQ